jgi:hypothetical protein
MLSVSNRLFVVFSSCESLEGRDTTARPYGLTKPQVSRIAFKSLWKALNNSQFPHWRLACSDNSSSQGYRDWIGRHSWAHFASEGVTVYPVTSNEQRNDKEIHRIVDLMGAGDEDWVLLAEDDQVWAGDSLYLALDFINTIPGDYILVPYVQPYMIWAGLAERQVGSQIEGPDVMSISKIMAREKPRVIPRTPLHFWMQVWWTNGTLITKAGLLRKWWAESPTVLEHRFMENKLQTVPGFAPIPPLSTHFQESVQSPGFNQRVTEEWVRDFLK